LKIKKNDNRYLYLKGECTYCTNYGGIKGFLSLSQASMLFFDPDVNSEENKAKLKSKLDFCSLSLGEGGGGGGYLKKF
jgi:hypothetical protein